MTLGDDKAAGQVMADPAGEGVGRGRRCNGRRKVDGRRSVGGGLPVVGNAGQGGGGATQPREDAEELLLDRFKGRFVHEYVEINVNGITTARGWRAKEKL